MTDTVAVVVQARSGSTRLPRKVLKPLAGKPAIVRMMERVSRVRNASTVLVATSTDPDDHDLVSACEAHGIACVRGPLDDVLARYVQAVPEACEVVVRLTGDCPLVDPDLVDHHIAAFHHHGHRADYVTNAVERTYPDGLDVEVVRRTALEEAHRMATDPADREHVLPWVRRHGQMVTVTQPVDLSDLRWTLDTEEDYRMIAEVYETLCGDDNAFDSRDVYELLLTRPRLVLSPAPAADVVRRIQQHLALVDDGQ